MLLARFDATEKRLTDIRQVNNGMEAHVHFGEVQYSEWWNITRELRKELLG